MENILLINPPLHYSGGVPHSLDATVPPLGLLYVACYINKYSSDFKAEILDVGVEGTSLHEMRERILASGPCVIGIHSMTPQLQGTLELAKFIKNNISKEITIFLGGPHVSADPGFIDRHTNLFDYAVIGEGERTFLDLLNKLARGNKIPRIHQSEIIKDLDSIPFPDRKLIRRGKYKKTESMLFSRGCPYKCYYCSRPAISKKVRYRSVANMVAEIKESYGYCGGHIDFQDDTFTLNRKKVLELCEEIQKAGLKLDWRCNTRIDLVDDELLCSMKKAGCSLIHFGIESGNEQLRKNQIRKGVFTNDDIMRVSRLCRKHGIKIAGYFMIGHPGETKESLEETKKMIFNLQLDIVGVSIPTPFPGSTLYDIAEKRGIINARIIDDFGEKKLGEGYSGNYPIYVPEGIDREHLFAEMKYINRKFYFNFRTMRSRILQDFISPRRLKSDLIDFFYMVFQGTSSRKPYKNKRM